MKHPVSFDDPPPQVTPLEKNTRLLSVACYLGLAPILWFFGPAYRKNDLLTHHLRYSLAFNFVVLCVLVIQTAVEAILILAIFTAMQSWIPASDANIWIFRMSMILIVPAVLFETVWNIAWTISLIGALVGRAWRMPLIAQIASSNAALQITVYSSILAYVFFLWLIGIGVDSVRLSKTQPEKADVYVLYTVGGYIPAEGLYETYTPPGWAVTMAFYPLVQAAIEEYGDEGVAVLPLSEATFNEAIQNGRFIFLASHGAVSPGALAISVAPYREYGPSNVPQNLVGQELQFVYFAGCEAGHLESEWRRVLGLDDAIMFDRISYVAEHLLWVWTKSPTVIAGLD